MNIPANAWNPLDEVEPPTQDELVRERQADEDRLLDQAYLSTFSTPVGQKVLQHMQDSCNTMTGFDPGLGLLDGIANGFSKEGIKIFVNTIRIRIERAQNYRSE